ncbi:MAG: MnhB domain-containing protein [bacterium]|nr:MnhB domain-containing protein [bacterium]
MREPLRFDDLILKEVGGLLVPFLQMFGVYVIFHGHLSPGGGFSGGTVAGISMILFSLVFGLGPGLRKVSHDATRIMESSGTLWYGLVGLVGVLRGASFLMNRGAGIPLGTPGRLFSGGLILLITVGVGIKVASAIISLYYLIVED